MVGDESLPLTVNDSGVEGPIEGAGFVTVTGDVPAAATSAAKIAAVTCVLLTYVVTRFAPLNCTVAPFTKPIPLTFKVKAPVPTAALDGEREVSVGATFLVVKDIAFEIPPDPGLVTVTFTTPAVEMSAAEIVAVNCVAL
jgi:hypothetical protein